MEDTTDMVIIDQCEIITGIKAKNKVQVKAELLQFIKNEDAEDLLTDTNDLLYLFEVAATLSIHTTSEVMTEELIAICTEKELTRSGRAVKNQQEIIDTMTLISFSHSDVEVQKLEGKGGYVFRHEAPFILLLNWKQGGEGESVKLVHCTLHLLNIKDLEILKTLCPVDLFNKKNWSPKKRLDRIGLQSDGWTRHQIAELLEDRKIINYGR